ncbi:DUF6376 family protein [Metabacillus sp. HB246100]|uniref:DUF6376 family protein n=1 Tax=Bacillus weihaiensis TaxID=1547283 RepID=UPI0023551C4A|nr:DUF6376 family protein [Bacillus weihaiensis]
MKKIMFFLFALFLLSGCSLVEEVSNGVNYVAEATEFVEEVSTFTQDIPALTEQAVTDEQARMELETKLMEIKEDMEEFNTLQAPDMAADVHQQIVEYNNAALKNIDSYLEMVENGTLDITAIEEYELIQSLQEISKTLDKMREFRQ